MVWPGPVPMGTCAACGASGFVGTGGLRARRSGLVCPACERRRAQRELRRTGLLLAGALVLNLAVGGGAAAWVPAWLGVLVVSVVVHELGHAGAAWTLGFEVRAVRIGTPVALRLQLGRTRVELGPLPFGGLTIPVTRDPRRYRLRRGLVVLAGPLANAALAVIVWRVPGVVPGAVGVRWALVLQVLLVVENLVPRRVATADGPAATDGALLLDLVRLRDGGLAAALATETLAGAVCDHLHGVAERAPADAAATVEPVDGLVALRMGQTAYLADDHERAAVLYGQALRSGALTTRDRALAANDLAWILAGERRGPDRLGDADALSAEAFALLGWHPAVRNTRGVVLILTGRPADGTALLAPTVDDIPPRSTASKARCLAVLAEGYLALGDLYAARRAVQRALAVGPGRPEVVAVRDAFAAAARAAGVPVALAPAPRHATTRTRAQRGAADSLRR
jgi:hypothetical protein